MSRIADTLLALPAGQWLPLCLAVVVGLALWAAGNRLLRPVFAIGGLTAGLGVGWLLVDGLQLSVPGWTVMAVLGLVCAVVAALAYRAAIAVGLALVLGIAAPVSLWSFAEAPAAASSATEVLGTPEAELPQTAQSSPLDELDSWLDRLTGRADDSSAETAEEHSASAVTVESAPDSEDESPGGLAGIRTAIDTITDQVTQWWAGLPGDLQTKLMAAAAVGAVVGFLFGTLASTLSASMVTACLGAGAWMAGGWSAVTRIGLPGTDWLPTTPTAWLTWWLLISVIGLLIQWTLWPKRADTAG